MKGTQDDTVPANVSNSYEGKIGMSTAPRHPMLHSLAKSPAGGGGRTRDHLARMTGLVWGRTGWVDVVFR